MFTATKDVAPVPVGAIEVRFTGVVVLLLVRVIACIALAVPEVTLPKASELADRVMVAGLTPVPARATDWVAVLALSVKTSVADLLPVAVGAKRINTVQLVVTARELGQLLICVKEVGFAPPNATEVIASATAPELVSVTAWAGL